jgi:hypothetical protein
VRPAGSEIGYCGSGRKASRPVAREKEIGCSTSAAIPRIAGGPTAKDRRDYADLSIDASDAVRKHRIGNQKVPGRVECQAAPVSQLRFNGGSAIASNCCIAGSCEALNNPIGSHALDSILAGFAKVRGDVGICDHIIRVRRRTMRALDLR